MKLDINIIAPILIIGLLVWGTFEVIKVGRSGDINEICSGSYVGNWYIEDNECCKKVDDGLTKDIIGYKMKQKEVCKPIPKGNIE